MSVSIAGRPVRQPGALSDLGRLSLAFVDGGLEWLAWAGEHPAARYDFPDETTLLAQVQMGLHGSPFALLPSLGLMVSPVKLMTLDLPSLRVLAKAEAGEGGTQVTGPVQHIFAAHRLLDQAALAAPQAWLAELGVADAPVFQGTNFLDRVLLVDLMNDPLQAASDAALAKEAAAFAVKQARTPPEFADYLSFYQALAGEPDALSLTAEQRSTRAANAMDTLLPLLFGALDCPQVEGLPSPAEVGQAIGAWLASGKQVGFSRLSEGLRQVVCHAAFEHQTGHKARQLVEHYLNQAQSLLATVRPHRGQMGQDGHTCVFHLTHQGRQAQLLLSGNGVISLQEFGLEPSAPHTLPPPLNANPPEIHHE